MAKKNPILSMPGKKRSFLIRENKASRNYGYYVSSIAIMVLVCLSGICCLSPQTPETYVAKQISMGADKGVIDDDMFVLELNYEPGCYSCNELVFVIQTLCDKFKGKIEFVTNEVDERAYPMDKYPRYGSLMEGCATEEYPLVRIYRNNNIETSIVGHHDRDIYRSAIKAAISRHSNNKNESNKEKEND